MTEAQHKQVRRWIRLAEYVLSRPLGPEDQPLLDHLLELTEELTIAQKPDHLALVTSIGGEDADELEADE